MGAKVSTVLWKAIKPQRFKAEEIQKALERKAAYVADQVLLDFLLTVSQWSTQPKFEKLVQVGPESVEVLVGTDDFVYKLVSGGTRPHIIRVKRARALRFQAGYKAKTMPGVISSQSGGAFGPNVYALQVQHPGTEARKFEETIGKKWRPRFKREMEQALVEGGRASGHGIR